MTPEYRLITRTVKTGFNTNQQLLVLQKYVDVTKFAGNGVYHLMSWVDCNANDIQDAVLTLFCKKEKEVG